MDRWPYEVGSWGMSDILSAVKDERWQRFRLSLKGVPTTEKLDRLDEYKRTWTSTDDCIRVDNYINALKRGGQLSVEGDVRR